MEIYLIIYTCICVFTCQRITADESATAVINSSDEPEPPVHAAVTNRSAHFVPPTAIGTPSGGIALTQGPQHGPSVTAAPTLGSNQRTVTETVVESATEDTTRLLANRSSSTDSNDTPSEGSETYTTGVFDSTDEEPWLPDENLTMILPDEMENETQGTDTTPSVTLAKSADRTPAVPMTTTRVPSPNLIITTSPDEMDDFTELAPEATDASAFVNISDTEGEGEGDPGLNGTLPDYDYFPDTIVNEIITEDDPQTNTTEKSDDVDTSAEAADVTVPAGAGTPGPLTDSNLQPVYTSSTAAGLDSGTSVRGQTTPSTQGTVDRSAPTAAPMDKETGSDLLTGHNPVSDSTGPDESMSYASMYATRGGHHDSSTAAGVTGELTTDHGTPSGPDGGGVHRTQSVSAVRTESGQTVLPDEPKATSESTTVSTTAARTIDPCLSTICHFGAACIHGRCQCRPSCPHELIIAPICASDGQTYMSTCDMEVVMCHRHRLLTVVRYKPCEFDACADVDCPCGQTCSGGACSCTDDDMPICADDAETYPSECAMRAAACQSDRTLTARYRVPCANITRLIEVGEAKGYDEAVSDGHLTYILIGLGCGVVLAIVIVAAIFKMRNKRTRLGDEEQVPMMPGSCRSPTRVTFEERSEKSDDLDTISDCVSPLNEYTTFFSDCNGKDTGNKDAERATPDTDSTADDKKGENPKTSILKKDGRRRVLSSTDTGVSELVLEETMPVLTTFTAPKVPSHKKDAPGAKKMLVSRPLSQIDNSVPEIDPEQDTVLELDDVFGTEMFVTKL